MFVITRFGDPLKYIRETNSNFTEVSTSEDILVIGEEDSLAEYCDKVNHNFGQFDVDCFLYPQMQIDALFRRVNECFEIVNPNGNFMQS